MPPLQDVPPTSDVTSLHHLPIGKAATVASLLAEGITRRRILDLGLIPGTKVEAVRQSPVGNLKAYRVRGAVIAFRKEEADQILINS